MEINFFLIKDKTGQLFDEKGKRMAVTYLKIPETVVLQCLEKKGEKQAVKVGLCTKVLAKCKKPQPQRRLYEKLGLKNGFYYLRKITILADIECKPGKTIDLLKLFSQGDLLLGSGLSKGRGFAGVMKRWGFHGGPKTHGQSDRARAIGSIGQRTDPGRVRRGKKMPGHMGNSTVTVKNLNVLGIDEDEKIVVIKGIVPGRKGSLLSFSKRGLNKIIKPWKELNIKKVETSESKELKKDDTTPTLETETENKAEKENSKKDK